MNLKQKLTLPALFLACGLLLPMVFHTFGMAGKIFLPMHIPVLMAGLLLGWKQGLCIGFFTPILSSLLTGMPPLLPMAPVMAVELALYGATAGYLRRTQKLSPLFALIGALIMGRLGAALIIALFAETLHIKLSPWIYVMASITNGILGIIIQIVGIPPLIAKLEQYLLQNRIHN